jgi:hypothetical protein
MTQTKKETIKEKPKSNFLLYLIMLIVVISIGGYWYYTKDESAETYKIRSSGGEDFYGEKQYINLTGKAAEEKKIKLSEDYWTKGKFNFK